MVTPILLPTSSLSFQFPVAFSSFSTPLPFLMVTSFTEMFALPLSTFSFPFPFSSSFQFPMALSTFSTSLPFFMVTSFTEMLALPLSTTFSFPLSFFLFLSIPHGAFHVFHLPSVFYGDVPCGDVCPSAFHPFLSFSLSFQFSMPLYLPLSRFSFPFLFSF